MLLVSTQFLRLPLGHQVETNESKRKREPLVFAAGDVPSNVANFVQDSNTFAFAGAVGVHHYVSVSQQASDNLDQNRMLILTTLELRNSNDTVRFTNLTM